MKRDDFGHDAGLNARMVLTLFLLGLVYAVLIAVSVTAGAGTVDVLVIAGILLAFQLLASDRIALAAMGARQVSVAEQPELHAIVERLCVQADLPKPRLALVDSRMPNALPRPRLTSPPETAQAPEIPSCWAIPAAYVSAAARSTAGSPPARRCGRSRLR